MDPFTLETTIARPREVVFDYLADLANHPEFTDHFLKGWHMTREETSGVGAGGRFEADLPFTRFGWGDYTLVDAQAPRRLVFAGRAGKFNRIRTVTVFDLREGSGGATRVELTAETRPALATDHVLESLGQRRALRRGWRKALKRLRLILEEDRARGPRATIAGGPRKPATDY
ncbi:MAG TPA: SRPBCC family protein [Solirubrobacteraceae bacterium]|nr:SRPBCC family protein [Solirubrobacteraceae bacterium]